MNLSGEGKVLHLDASTELAARVHYHLETKQIGALPKTTGVLTILNGPSDLELQTEFILVTDQGRRFHCGRTGKSSLFPGAQISVNAIETE